MTTITAEQILGAEALLGLGWSARERSQMLGNIASQSESAQQARSHRIANGVPTAQRFDPRLADFAMPSAAVQVTTAARVPPLPAAEEDIAFAPLVHLSGWIASGVLSAQRLTRIYLDRIAAIGPRLECWATVVPEQAMAEAAAADSLLSVGINLGPLHGIPYGVKDLFDTRGIVTGWGAEPFRARVPEQDAAIVTLLRRAGAVLLGKTTVGALAYNDIWYGGVTRNPWNLNEGSSGSSAGSASATAAGLCGFAIGTETLGSITAPSQRCGTTGLRPTFGRVSRAGAMALCPSLDKVGPICRAVEDTALVLSVLNGYDPADRGSIGAGFSYDGRAGIEGLRVGYLPEAFGEGATEVDHAALSAARKIADVRAVALPDLPYGALMGSVAKLLGPRDFPVGRLYIFPSRSCAGEGKMIDFKGVHYPKSVILYAVFFYLRYAVSYRDLEEIMAERGVRVDHATLNRWVVKFSPLIAARAQARKRPTATSWRADETYIKVKGKWTYLYRAVDRDGQTLDFTLSKRRDLAAARRFFRQAIAAHGVPDRVVIDKSGANLAGLQALNVILKFTGNGHDIKVRQIKYLNNILEQDHRFIKRITTPMMGFKAFHSAAATIAGIETAHMIRKGQIPANATTPFQTFADLAA